MSQYEEEKYAAKRSVDMNSTAEKPGVLLLGDSIRLGYCRFVKENLADIADVRYPDENCANTQTTFIRIALWASLFPNAADVKTVLFNCGHWDVAEWDDDGRPLNSVETYTDMLTRIAAKLKKYFPNATVSFLTTTPMSPDGRPGPNPRTNEIIERYNAAAIRALSAIDIPILDLYTLFKSAPNELYYDYCHFTEDGYRQLAETITAYIVKTL